MATIDALIGAGGVIVGGALGYGASSRDRRQRGHDAIESRNFAIRREACLLLERQRLRQIEAAEALSAHYKRGDEFEERKDHTDLQNPDVDAMVSLFLPDRIEQMVEEMNGLWSAFLSSCGAIERAEKGQAKVDAYKGMDAALVRLKEISQGLRQALREEARSQ